MAVGARILLLSFVLGTSGAACSLGSFTGYTTGDANDAGNDASPSVDGGGENDANVGSDGGTNDGAASGDAADGACTAFFCDDFEKAGAIDVRWDQIFQTNGGELVAAATPVHSGARSARVHIPTGTSPRAYLAKSFSTTTKHVTFSFWIHLPAPGRIMQIARVLIEAPDGKAGNLILQAKANGGLLVAEQYFDGVSFVGYVAHDVSAFTADTWQHWTLEIDATSAPPHGKVYVDGALASDEALTNPFVAGVMKVYVGSTYVDDGPEITFHVDDVAADFVP